MKSGKDDRILGVFMSHFFWKGQLWKAHESSTNVPLPGPEESVTHVTDRSGRPMSSDPERNSCNKGGSSRQMFSCVSHLDLWKAW